MGRTPWTHLSNRWRNWQNGATGRELLSAGRCEKRPGRRVIETRHGDVGRAVTFGDVLRKLIEGQSISELASAINVDKSVIYRWRQNDRVPQLDSQHVDNLARTLRLTGPERERLRQAQIATLSAPRRLAPRPPKTARASHTMVDQLLVRSASPSPLLLPSAPAPAKRTAQPAVHRTGALRGRDAVIAQAIELLRAAPQATGHAEILLPVQGGSLFAGVEGEAEVYAAWQQALRGALARGWQVTQLWRLDRDVTRTFNLVETMLNLIGSGRYHPRFFERYGLLRPPYDMIIVPPSTALLMFSTESDEVVDGGWVVKDEEHVALLIQHFEQLRARTRPLLQEFNPQLQELELTRALTEAESRLGGRRLIRKGLSALTNPPAWWRADSRFLDYVVRSGFVRGADLPAYRATLERRWQSFTRRVQTFEFRDICPASVIERMAAGDDYIRPDDPQAGFDVSLGQRLEHLRHVAEIVRTYPNYHLALPNSREEELLSIEPARCVDGDHDAFINTVSHDERGETVRVDLHITEGTIVWALREHFDSLWERIAEQHRERGYVLHCLEEQIALLEQRVGQ